MIDKPFQHEDDLTQEDLIEKVYVAIGRLFSNQSVLEGRISRQEERTSGLERNLVRARRESLRRDSELNRKIERNRQDIGYARTGVSRNSQRIKSNSSSIRKWGLALGTLVISTACCMSTLPYTLEEKWKDLTSYNEVQESNTFYVKEENGELIEVTPTPLPLELSVEATATAMAEPIYEPSIRERVNETREDIGTFWGIAIMGGVAGTYLFLRSKAHDSMRNQNYVHKLPEKRNDKEKKNE